MDLRTITTFKTIVELKSFQAAAEHLNYAQSTITAHVKKLENALGVTLFDRENNLQLTKAGMLLDEKSNILLQSYDQLTSSMIAFLEGETELIRIGVMEPTASYRMPNVLAQFRKEFPDSRLSLQVHGSKALTEMVMKEELELAICATPEKHKQTTFDVLFAEKVVLLLPENDPLIEKESISLADLQHETLMITNRHCPFRGIFETKMLEKGWLPAYGMEVSNMLTLKYYVQSGFGPAVVPLVAVSPPPEDTVVRHITDFEEGLSVGVLTKEIYGEQQSIRRLIALMQTELS